MDTKYLVVDQPLDDVEDAPAGQDESEMEPPVWCQASLPPSRDRGDGSGQYKNPGRRMKEAVCQRVDFQPGNGVHRVAAYVADHVVPLQDLVEEDPVDETTEPEAHEEGGPLR